MHEMIFMNLMCRCVDIYAPYEYVLNMAQDIVLCIPIAVLKYIWYSCCYNLHCYEFHISCVYYS